MPITFSNLNVGQKLKKDLAFTQDDLRYAAERQRDRIVKRTGQGLDVDGIPFKTYSNKYAERKSKTGRDSGIVDLTWSGRMLKALKVNQVSATNPGGFFVLGIYGAEGVRAAVHDGGLGKAPRRKFMGVTQQEKFLIARDIASRAKARAQGTSLNVAA